MAIKLIDVKNIIVPGLVFQSTMIGGGYATGRELVEYFMLLGPLKGLVAMITATICISIICALAFAFAHTFKLYDYRSFFKKLLGQSWPLFEFGYLCLCILVLSILCAAAGSLATELFGTPHLVGTVSFLLIVAFCLSLSSELISKLLSYWSVLLYSAFLMLVALSIQSFEAEITAHLTPFSVSLSEPVALANGVSYAGYNIVVFTATLFCLRPIATTKRAVLSGLMCGPLSMLPGIMLFIVMLAHYPTITGQELPLNFVIKQFDKPLLLLLFQIIILGTFIETAVAILHSINERVRIALAERTEDASPIIRSTLAMLCLLFAMLIAKQFGLLALIRDGYKYSSIYFLAIVILPLITVGVFQLTKHLTIQKQALYASEKT